MPVQETHPETHAALLRPHPGAPRRALCLATRGLAKGASLHVAFRTAQALALGLVLACASATDITSEPSGPLFYEIEGGRGFLFGTIHVPDEELRQLPEAAQAGFDDADVLYTEVLMDEGTQARVQALIGPAPPLAERLDPELLARVTTYFAARGVDVRALDHQPTWSIGVALALVDRLAATPDRATLDETLSTRAGGGGKERRGLEKPEEQIQLFEALPEEAQIAMLRETLDGLEAAEAGGEQAPTAHPVDTLVDAWRAGDEQALLQMTESSMGGGDSRWERELLEGLLYGRSATMAGRIAGHLAEEPERVHFFAIGAGHLPGPRGVVTLLREHGLDVRRR